MQNLKALTLLEMLTQVFIQRTSKMPYQAKLDALEKKLNARDECFIRVIILEEMVKVKNGTFQQGYILEMKLADEDTPTQ